ncbi:MAG TPA: DUF305 domain-containing protein [Gemmatimonadaceae bacterium]|nr:DUF305 domain-containing protein [Gemmatimonadaceae bacterium]
MPIAPRCTRITTLLAAITVAGCSSAARSASDAPTPQSAGSPLSPAAVVTADRGIPPYTDADVHFMSGMIPHHAQAVLIAGWAASHGARDDVRILCERIVVAQRDEIATMRRWLSERGEAVPAADATHMTMTMNGMQHDMLMPGMLTAEQLAELDRARGAAFDELFLTSMIRHHRGALTMVDELFASPGAANDDTIFKFASDVFADQTTEIDRMEQMLGR